MTNDAKEWVTVKVPKDVRDDARDDPRTYGEIMRAGVVFPIQQRTRERFIDLKAKNTEDGVPEMNADLFLQSLMDMLEAAEEGYYDGDDTDTSLTYDDVKAACGAALRDELADEVLGR